MPPGSRRIRQRPTELGINYLVRQLPVDNERRAALRQATGSDAIPALVLEDGTSRFGEDAIRRFLDAQSPSQRRRKRND